MENLNVPTDYTLLCTTRTDTEFDQFGLMLLSDGVTLGKVFNHQGYPGTGIKFSFQLNNWGPIICIICCTLMINHWSTQHSAHHPLSGQYIPHTQHSVADTQCTLYTVIHNACCTKWTQHNSKRESGSKSRWAWHGTRLAQL